VDGREHLPGEVPAADLPARAAGLVLIHRPDQRAPPEDLSLRKPGGQVRTWPHGDPKPWGAVAHKAGGVVGDPGIASVLRCHGGLPHASRALGSNRRGRHQGL